MPSYNTLQIHNKLNIFNHSSNIKLKTKRKNVSVPLNRMLAKSDTKK